MSLNQTLSDESYTSTQSDSERLWSDGSNSGIGPDPRSPTSPPTSVEDASWDELAAQPPDGQQPRSAHVRAQPQESLHNVAAVVGEGIEHQTLNLTEGATRPEAPLRPDSDLRSSRSSTRTADTLLTFVSGSVSEALKHPQHHWAFSLLLLHYVIFVCYQVVQLTLNLETFTTSGNPNSSEETLVRMPKLFGALAHEVAVQAHRDTVKMLDALSSTATSDARWEAIFDNFIDIVSACVGYANQTLNGTKCSDAWKAANLGTSDDSTPAVAPSDALQKRKLQQIKEVFEDHDLKARPGLSSTTQIVPFEWVLLICSILIISGVVLIVVFHHRLRPAYAAMIRAYRRSWRRRRREYGEKDRDIEVIGKSSVVASGRHSMRDSSSLLTRRLGVPDARFLPNSIWEVASRGMLEDTRQLWEHQSGSEKNRAHPRHGTVLSAAARSGNVDLVTYLLTHGSDFTAEGGYYHNALQSGACSGNVDVVQKLLEAGARDVSVGGYFRTALNAAAEKRSSEMLSKLLQHTTDPSTWVNVSGGLQGKALIAAASSVDSLLAYNAELDGANESGETALHAAAASNRLQTVKKLLQRQSNKDAVSTTHGTALHAACRGKCIEIAMVLVEHGASVSITDQNLRTVLHEASKSGLTAVGTDGNTALHHAAIGGFAEITSLLIKHGIDVSIGDKFKAQALFRAAGCKHPEVVRILLEEGKADPDAVDCFNQTALHGPAETDDVSVQRLSIGADGNVNAVGAWNRTPLHEACNMARYKNVELLLSQPDIDVNVIDDDQTTPLCRSLCSTDGRYKDQCIDARIPLMLLDYKELECERLSKRIKPDHRKGIDVNSCHGLAIQEAARKNLIEVVRKMTLEHNANIHIPGGKYGGVLQAAAIGGDEEVLALLMKHKANANLQGGEFGSPLAAAAAYGNVAVVRLLLENGADATVTGVGKYGSALGSVCKALKEDETGQAKIDHLTRQLEDMLQSWGGELTMSMPHLRDRWQLMPSGWDWNTVGEL